jgi:hypothetical protein
MKLYVLVYEEHYTKYLDLHTLLEGTASLQSFLRDIGTASIAFQRPLHNLDSNYVSFKEVPMGSCVRLWQPHQYVDIIHEKLFVDSHEKEDKSRRRSSCVIV